ncbi:hypothetical protein [Pseudomonas brassicacearum]|uniref:hypothetical protein n=1 Tax=Pseudomonas brassicacearum TaxID=930166 RepID=UPI00076175A4|nr:hypothetical protein [Pseudomonas brassicacearum]
MTEKVAPDWERIEAERKSLLPEDVPIGVERDLVRLFMESFQCGIMEDRIPLASTDTIILEMSVRYGRADIVVFHTDGTASVIEAKDGSKGYNHVVSGIGQAALYAVQIAQTKGAVKRVRKCLMWTSAGDVEVDAAIEGACEAASVIPMPWPSMRILMSTGEAVRRVMGVGVQ